jgi:hypothetical protein
MELFWQLASRVLLELDFRHSATACLYGRPFCKCIRIVWYSISGVHAQKLESQYLRVGHYLVCRGHSRLGSIRINSYGG